MSIRTVTLILGVLFASHGLAQSAEIPETKALKDSCSTYLKVKEQKTLPAHWSAEQAASVGFCKGFFRGFMSSSADQFTEPDEKGRVQEITIASTTTYDQAIRVFVTALEVKPELLAEDAGVVILATMQLAGLMTTSELPARYVKTP